MELLYSAAESIVSFMNDGPGLLATLLYLAIATFPVVLLHELGHAVVAASRLGGDVEVAVGNAGKVAEVRLGQITASLNAFSSPGRVSGSASVDASRATARDIIFIALAGPVASALGLGVTLILMAVAPDSGVVHNGLWTAAFLGAGAVVLNIVPFTFQERRDGPSLRTDGRLALDAVRTLRSLR